MKHVILVSADTIVVLPSSSSSSNKWKILEKPRDKNHAFEMLMEQSGREQIVITAISLFYLTNDCNSKSLAATKQFHVETKVVFGTLQPDLVKWYIEERSDQHDGPLDKAGAYGYQGFAGYFVQEIHGCYYNVVGLPCQALLSEINDLINKYMK